MRKLKKAFALMIAVAICAGVIGMPTFVQAATKSAYSQIQGESFNSGKSKSVSKLTANDGTKYMGTIQNGDYACYKDVMFGYGISKFTMRYSKKNIFDTEIKIYLDKVGSNCIGTIHVGKTGNTWTDFKTYEWTLKKKVTGIHDVYLKFKANTSEDLLRVDWFKFSADSSNYNFSLPPVGMEFSDSDGVKYKVLSDQKSIAVIDIPNSTQYWQMKNAFTFSSNGTHVGMRVTKIANNACQNCKKLKEVYLGEYCKTIGAHAFKNCESLYLIRVNGEYRKMSIEPSAFYDIRKFANFAVPYKNVNYFKSVLNGNKYTKAKKFNIYPGNAAG